LCLLAAVQLQTMHTKDSNDCAINDDLCVNFCRQTNWLLQHLRQMQLQMRMMQIFTVMMRRLLVQQQVPMQGLVNDAWKVLHRETRLLQPNAPNKAALDGEAKSGPCTTCVSIESCTLSCLWMVCIIVIATAVQVKQGITSLSDYLFHKVRCSPAITANLLGSIL